MSDVERFIENIESIADTDPMDGELRSYDAGECQFCGQQVTKADWERNWTVTPSGDSFSKHLVDAHDVEVGADGVVAQPGT